MTGETVAKISYTGLSPSPDDGTPGRLRRRERAYTALPPGVYHCEINIDP